MAQRGLVAVVAIVVENRGAGARQALAVARRLGLRVDAADLGQARVEVRRLPAPPQQVDEGVVQEEERVARAVGHVEHDAADAAVAAAVRGALDAVPGAVPRVLLEARLDVDVGGAVQAVERQGAPDTGVAVCRRAVSAAAGGVQGMENNIDEGSVCDTL